MIVSVDALFVSDILPLAALIALKLVTIFVFVNAVPPTEFVVSNAPVKVPTPSSDTVPPPVNEILPLVLMLPAFNATLRPAVAAIVPVVLPTFVLKSISLDTPVADNVTPPEPPAVTVLPNVSVPLAFKVMLPFAAVLIAPIIVMPPVLLMTIFPPPVSFIPVIVNGLAEFVNWMPPLVVFVPLKFVNTFTLFKVMPPTEFVVSVTPEIALFV